MIYKVLIGTVDGHQPNERVDSGRIKMGHVILLTVQKSSDHQLRKRYISHYLQGFSTPKDGWPWDF